MQIILDGLIFCILNIQLTSKIDVGSIANSILDRITIVLIINKNNFIFDRILYVEAIDYIEINLTATYKIK